MGTPISFNSGTTASYTAGIFKKATVGLNLKTGLVAGNNWWNGVDVSASQYLIYSDIYSQGQSTFAGSRPTAWSTPDLSDASLILLINTLPDRVGLPGFTTVSQAVNWLNQTGKYFLIKTGYENIVTSNLKVNMDAGWYNSYPGNGSTWSDISGNFYSATLYNGPGFSGNDNGVLVFDGTDDYGSFGQSLVGAGNTAYTVIVWCKRNRNNVGYEELLSQWTNAGSGNSFFFGFDNSNVRFSDNWNPITVPGAGKVGEWMCLVGVNTGSNAYIYLNGVLMATKGSALTYGATGNMVIGRQGEIAGEYFSGSIGLVQIYNVALTSSQILQNFYTQAYRFGLYNNVVTSSLEAYFNVGEVQSYSGSGVNLLDLSGNDRNAVLYNGPTYSSNGYLTFDGTDDYGYMGTTTFPTYTNFTITAFIKIGTTLNHRGIFCIKPANQTEDYTGNAFAFHTISGGYFGLESANLYPGNTSSNNTSITYQQAHIAVVCNQDTKILTYYLNGIADGTQTITGGYTFNNQNAVFLFCRQYASTGPTNIQNPLEGTLHELNFYPRALSISEIKQNYYQGNIVTDNLQLLLDAGNLVSYPTNGSPVYDLTTNGNNGSFVNGITYSTSVGGNFYFTGTVNYINLTSTTNIRLNGNYSTFSIWCYIRGFSGGGNQYAELYGVYGANRTGIKWQSDGIGMDANGDFYSCFVSVTNAFNQWMNITCVIDRINTVFKVYKNGSFVGSDTFSSYSATSTNVSIGGNTLTGNQYDYINGSISNVMVYNDELTPLQIAQNFNAYKSRYGL